MTKATRTHWVIQWVTWFGFLLLYLPLASLVIFSFLRFPEGTADFAQHEWTLEWYRKLAGNQLIVDAFTLSLEVGFWATLGSTLLGTAAALALTRSRFIGRRVFDTFTYVPMILPEIVMGLALLVWFVLLRITLGSVSIVLAHITFSVSYVTLSVKSRLQNFDELLIDAARDLGAPPLAIFLKVILPLIWPGILSGSLMAFTLSFDDFLITFFTAGANSDTLPLKIYSMIKFGLSPEINALSTLLLGATFVLVVILFQFSSPSRIKERRVHNG